MFRLPALILTVLVLIGCAAPTAPAPPSVTPPATRSSTATASAIPATHAPTAPPPTLAPTASPVPPASLWLDPAVTSDLRASILKVAATQDIATAPGAGSASLRVTPDPTPDPLILTERVFAVADRFATLRTGFKLSDLKQIWAGTPADEVERLVVTPDTAAALTPLLGPPSTAVQPVEASALADTLWKTNRALALVPFDELTPRLLALPLDGQNILDRTTDLAKYPLVVRLYVEGSADRVPQFYNALRAEIEPTNRDAGRMTSLIMTGVTAMGRYTANAIEQRGDPAFPARVIAPVLAAADITHISNEIPFATPCPPNLVQDSIVLCSKPEYIEALKLVGADIVGLTGNHAGDFGYDNYVKTLELYTQNGMKYYAGGRDLAQARKPLILEHNGNRLAFLGANSFGPQSYWATDAKPGTNGYDAARMEQDIAAARQQADVVLVEFQADEVYEYTPDAFNIQLFQRTIKQGADIVTGVQNHHPAAIEFPEPGKMILYGLGNLWFDQMYSDEVRGGLIPRHLFYKGKHLQTELLTTMLEYYAQPRWATPAERNTILAGVFGASKFSIAPGP